MDTTKARNSLKPPVVNRMTTSSRRAPEKDLSEAWWCELWPYTRATDEHYIIVQTVCLWRQFRRTSVNSSCNDSFQVCTWQKHKVRNHQQLFISRMGDEESRQHDNTNIILYHRSTLKQHVSKVIPAFIKTQWIYFFKESMEVPFGDPFGTKPHDEQRAGEHVKSPLLRITYLSNTPPEGKNPGSRWLSWVTALGLQWTCVQALNKKRKNLYLQ